MTRRSIERKIRKQRRDEDETHLRKIAGVAHQQEHCGKRCQRNDRDAAKQTVHTIRTVGEVDRDPEHKCGHQQEDPAGQHQRPAKERETVGFVKRKIGCGCAEADREIEQAFFQFAPGSGTAIVQIAGEHLQKEQRTVDYIFPAERNKHKEHQHTANAEDQPRPARLTLGNFTVDGVFSTLILGQARDADFDREKGEHKRDKDADKRPGKIVRNRK
ncbi:hypothetical protein SDC9_143508 [bioreactor metagenome]|uniref:Uncharacterized protein n=1 Tax=bioreactor metagenome TaxID=1076179 RepID=A0A645E4N3_9ZZZZ